MTAVDQSYPFDSSPIATEDQWRAFVQAFRADGVVGIPMAGISALASWVVSPNAGMVLNVSTGGVVVQGTFGRITSTKTVTIAANSSGNPRIDMIVARLDPVANAVTAEVLTGTPAASPAAPTLTQTSALWEIPLAQIAVANGASSITAADITDRRNLYVGLATAANPVHNASAHIWQKGTSLALVQSFSACTADRWVAYRYSGGFVGGGTLSQQTAGDTQGSGYCFRLQRDNGNSSTVPISFIQSLRSADSKRLAGNTFTLSVRARRSATATSSVLSFGMTSGTGTDESVANGFTGASALISSQWTLSTEWATYWYTVTAPTNLNQLGVLFLYTPAGTAGTADHIEIKDIRVDLGSAPLPHVPLPYAADLAECQPFFHRVGGVGVSDVIGIGWASSTTQAQMSIRHPVPMRAIPTLTVGDQTKFTPYDGTSAPASTAVALDGSYNPTKHTALVNFTTSGLVLGRAVMIGARSSTLGYLDFGAEI